LQGGSELPARIAQTATSSAEIERRQQAGTKALGYPPSNQQPQNSCQKHSLRQRLLKIKRASLLLNRLVCVNFAILIAWLWLWFFSGLFSLKAINAVRSNKKLN